MNNEQPTKENNAVDLEFYTIARAINSCLTFKEHDILSEQTRINLVEYIRTQRSLAQQEILDRVEEDLKNRIGFGSWGFTDNEFKGEVAVYLKDIIKLLSTLKDTNI